MHPQRGLDAGFLVGTHHHAHVTRYNWEAVAEKSVLYC
jgi:hypothetical protein